MAGYPFRLKIGDVEYLVRAARRDWSEKGDVTRPTHKHPVIRIRRGMGVDREADTLIHEILHAADWDKSEEWVGYTASTIAEALRKSGLLK